MAIGGDSDTERRHVLGVARSASGRAWVDRLSEPAARAAGVMSQHHGLADPLARVLAARGVTPEAAEAYLAPTLRTLLPDPSVLADMDTAAARLADAIAGGEAAVAIFGDYDVDGATSAALLARFLRAHGGDPAIHIPDRITEGYGPNIPAIEALAAGGARLLVTVDCGTTSHEALEAAARLGLDVVVLDHHQAGEALPRAAAVVNPNRQDDLSGLGHLAAVGVTFLTVVAIRRELRRRGFYAGRSEPDLMALTDLVALGTVADVVPLTGLNRAFVVQGLRVAADRGNAGLAALADAARLGGPPTPRHLGYMLGPRINAGGRIGDAGLGARLLLTDDIEAARPIAAELDRLNEERRAIEAAAVAEAEAMVGDRDDAVVVLGHRDWHPGVVGLVAARIKESTGRPALALALDADGGGTGSARSIPGVDIGAAIRAAVAAGVAVKGGGHAMAAGVTVPPGGEGALTAFLGDRLGAAVAAARAERRLPIDGLLTPGGASLDLGAMLEQAGPFGAGNAEPVFAFPAVTISYAEVAGPHVRCALRGGEGSSVRAIAFRAAERELGRLLLEARGRPLHVAGALGVDRWNGSERVSVTILDVADPAVESRAVNHRLTMPAGH